MDAGRGWRGCRRQRVALPSEEGSFTRKCVTVSQNLYDSVTVSFLVGNSIPDQYCLVSGTQFGLLCSETQWFTTALGSTVVSLRPETQGSLSLLLS